jgi:hypothetical protein
MNSSDALHRNSVFAFGIFSVFVLLAFWPSDSSPLLDQQTYHARAYGIAVALWCAFLIAQAYLLRTNRRAAHRRLGRVAYALVPALVLAAVSFTHFRLSDVPVPQLSDAEYYLLSLELNALVVFVAIYALAVRNRSNTALYARYMLATIFPLFTPITDRLIGSYAPELGGILPRIGDMPVLAVVGFALADIIVLALIVSDWRAKPRLWAFPITLGLLVAYQVSALTLYAVPAWRIFCTRFMHLPIS